MSAQIAVATNHLSILARYFRQFQKKEMPYKAKASIREEINPDEIPKRILEGEI